MKTSKEKVLLLDIKQPFAHYREPKVMQDEYIPTLNLPPATTIAGMISYLIDRQLKTEYKIGVVGTYKNKIVEFIRGEYEDFISNYEKLIKTMQKNDSKKHLNLSELYNYYKKQSKNRVMYFEVLQDVELKIFISTENNKLVKAALENPNKYLSLGRKEDFIMPAKKGGSFVKEVEIEKIFIENKKQAVKNNLVFRNTYVSVNLTNNQNNNIMEEGVLYALPKKYRDLEAEKKDRVIEYHHYVYINEEGAHLYGLEANVYKIKSKNGYINNVIFTWL